MQLHQRYRRRAMQRNVQEANVGYTNLMFTGCAIIKREASEPRKSRNADAFVAVYAVVTRATVTTRRTGAVIDDCTKTSDNRCPGFISDKNYTTNCVFMHLF